MPDASIPPKPYRNQTGLAELCIVMTAGMIAAAGLAFAGAGWWSVIAMPGCIALDIVSTFLRSSTD